MNPKYTKFLEAAGRSPLNFMVYVILAVTAAAIAITMYAPGSLIPVIVVAISILGVCWLTLRYIIIPGLSETGKLSDRTEATTQSAAVCYRWHNKKLQFLLVKSTSGKRRIFPKGNIKQGEKPFQAAEREAREEAGVMGEIQHEAISHFWHVRGKGDKGEMKIPAYLLKVVRRLSPDHEKNRDPKWYRPKQAKKALLKKRNTTDAKGLHNVLEGAVSKLNELAQETRQ